MAKTERTKANAETMARKQREISVSEFFAKNRHLLGFDNKRKALLTTVKEAVDNALENGEGDFMTSAVVYDHWWSILLVSWRSIEIKGDVGNSLGSGSRDID